MKKKDKDFIEDNLKHLRITVDIINEGMQKYEWNKHELAGIGVYLANVYNGYETILRTMLLDKEKVIPKGEQWHKNLLDVAKSEGLVPNEMSVTLKGMLAFRHRQTHGYSHMLKENDLRHFSLEVVKYHHVFEKHIQKIMEEITFE